MVVKVYISGISGNKEVKKRQQRVLMILDSKHVKYDVIDIAEPGREADKDFMQNNAKSNGGTVSDPNPRSALPPQIFNDDEYCGDYDQFDLANEVDTLEQFLKVEVPPEEPAQEENKETALNGDVEAGKNENESKSNETSAERDTASKEGTPAKEGISVKEDSPAKEDTPAEEGTPAKESGTSKEPSPAKDGSVEPSNKEGSPEKEVSPERQRSVEKQSTPAPKESSPEKEFSPEKQSDVESKKTSKENSPEKEESVNENGTASSREQSEEKGAVGDSEAAELKKDNPSEALIKNEQAAAAEE